MWMITEDQGVGQECPTHTDSGSTSRKRGENGAPRMWMITEDQKRRTRVSDPHGQWFPLRRKSGEKWGTPVTFYDVLNCKAYFSGSAICGAPDLSKSVLISNFCLGARSTSVLKVS
jgi:hypothetical protein